jgi:hypothetical protein
VASSRGSLGPMARLGRGGRRRCDIGKTGAVGWGFVPFHPSRPRHRRYRSRRARHDITSYRKKSVPFERLHTANERNVRYIIEQSAPPLQIYGTTGANWEASVIRHIPLVDPCSYCLFPPDVPQAQTACATDTVVQSDTGESIDASLPFLSFAAGLMAAAEVLKAGMPGYPFSPNRTTLYTHVAAEPRFVSSRLHRRQGCICVSRHSSVHRQMIAGTKYEALSTTSHSNVA